MGQALNHTVFANLEELLAPARPVLRMSKLGLRMRAMQFIQDFPGETAYAVKANPHALVIAELGRAGIETFDVASTEEMQLVRSVIPNAKLHYHNPVRSTEETKIALHAFNCNRFSVDHADALQQILANTSSPQDIEIAIRFRMETSSKAVQNFKSKFGVKREEAVLLANMARDMGFKVGLTFHPGSQTQTPSAYLEHLVEAYEISKGMKDDSAFLNVGGGFPTHYKGMEYSPLNDYFKAIKSQFEELFDASTVALECEPGRALVASAGTLVTTIKNARTDRKELYLNDGIYGGLMEFYQFPSLQPECSVDTDGENVDWTVYGPTCDPADVLPTKLALPLCLQEGDQVRFHGAGAYSIATATNFNGYGSIDVEMA